MIAEQSLGGQRQALMEGVDLLVGAGVMSHTGHINASVRVDSDRMLLTPTGLAGELRAETLAVVRHDGHVEDGRISASTSEIIGMHTAVYLAREDVAAVVHTHSPHLTAFALAHRPLPCRYEALLRHGQTEAVPIVPWAPRGSEASTRGIGEALARHPGSRAVLLANHGVLVGGPAATTAAKLLVVLEEAAAAELRAVALGGARDLPAAAEQDVQQSMHRAAGAQAG
ncbi:MAG: class II aldolase/adducin family protein [Pseudonocardiaceae bacterium]|nr:class II aldolase/adducin family protein [Pseudonocardiaceae bacterium]